MFKSGLNKTQWKALCGRYNSCHKFPDASISTMQYIHFVSTTVGWSYGLLILHTLGRHNVAKLSNDQRLKLIQYVKDHHVILHAPSLEREARTRGLESTISYL